MTLTQIAFLMRREAREKGKAQQPLRRGLVLTLTKTGPDWTLSLTRQGQSPSQYEVTTCRSKFDIPESATEEIKSRGGYHIIRLKWTESYTQASFAPPEGPNPYKYG